MKIFFGILIFAAVALILFKRASSAKKRLAERSMAREMLLMAQLARQNAPGAPSGAAAPALASLSPARRPAAPAPIPPAAPAEAKNAPAERAEAAGHNPLAPWRKEDIERAHRDRDGH